MQLPEKCGDGCRMFDPKVANTGFCARDDMAFRVDQQHKCHHIPPCSSEENCKACGNYCEALKLSDAEMKEM